MKYYLIVLALLFLPYELFSADYFPLRAGNQWMFNKVDSHGATCGTDFRKAEISHVFDRWFGYTINSQLNQVSGAYIDTLQLLNDSNDIYLFDEDSFVVYFKHNYRDGETLVIGSDTLVASFIGNVSVPAGCFDSCYFLKQYSVGKWVGWVYAPDVGPIKYQVGVNASLLLINSNLIIPTPTAIPSVDTFYENVTVSLLDSVSGTKIYYTLNNSTPDSITGLLYTYPFTLQNSTTVKVIAYKEGCRKSDVSIKNYTRAENTVALESQKSQHPQRIQQDKIFYNLLGQRVINISSRKQTLGVYFSRMVLGKNEHLQKEQYETETFCK